ncbi:hypothetical protein KAJ87_02165 [Candidatus Pacearchaeota archaeon]|nr:hypothetical protein [Candidatus Pacearchaeota archaeon]
MKFSELFKKYWDNLIVGIIAGLVLYYGLKIQNGIKAGIYIFTISILLILIYTFFIWLGRKYDLDKKFIHFFKNLNFRKFFIKYPFIAFILGIIILILMAIYPSLFNFISLGSQIRTQYFNTLITLFGSLFVLIFSISLIAIQVSSKKFSSLIVKRYIKDKAISASMVFFIFSILFCLTSYFYSNLFMEEVALFLVLLGLILIVSQFYLVGKYIDPVSISKDILEEIKKVNEGNEFSDKNKIQKFIEIHHLLISSNEMEARAILKLLVEFRKKINLPRFKGLINNYITVSGIEFAKEGKNSSLDCIDNILNLGEKEIDNLIKNNEEYVIESSVMQSRGILQEIVKTNIGLDINKVSIVQIQIYLLYECLFKKENKDLDSINKKQIQPFLEEFSSELKKIEPIQSRKDYIERMYEQHNNFIESLERRKINGGFVKNEKS